MALSRGTKLLVGIFAASGVVHLAKPDVYEPLMPAWVPAHREVIRASGVAELACAAGVGPPRRAGSPAGAARLSSSPCGRGTWRWPRATTRPPARGSKAAPGGRWRARG